MRSRLWIIGGLLLLAVSRAVAGADSFIALCYHDVRAAEDVGDDAYAISVGRLVAHLEWLDQHGYRPVSVDDLIAARAGERELPDKAVLLTFDDGYESVYDTVFPLLRAYGYPAVVSVVTSWTERGDRPGTGQSLASWQELGEMADSGLVEIASHTHDLHRGIQGNPQGNEQPAATTLRYDARGGAYETPPARRARIERDLRRSVDLIEERIGRRPRVITWPYGAYGAPGTDIARELGLGVGLTLRDGETRVDGLDAVARELLQRDTPLEDLVWELRHPEREDPQRVMHVDLDYVYDRDPAQQEENLDRLVQRVYDAGANTVYLQAFADPDGDGNADALYFPNRHLPVRADLFDRTAWQLVTRAGVAVYAWMPVLAFELPDDAPAVERVLRLSPDGTREPNPEGYARLSPFDPRARRIIEEIYVDLARYTHFDGLLFHDDAVLGDREDASAAARERYVDWGLPADVDAIRSDPGSHRFWTQAKTRHLARFTDRLAAAVHRFRPEIETARNLYARVVLEPGSEARFAQSLEVFLDHYDHVGLMAMPYLEDAGDPMPWLGRLVEAVADHPRGLARTVFELQSRDWRTGERVPAAELLRQMERLQVLGVRHVGYYPDDFIGGHPPLPVVRRGISALTNPFREAPP